MARNPRYDTPGSLHHVINRGIARRPLFTSAPEIRYFLSRLAHEHRRGRLRIHAFSVLTTHFHLLVESPMGQLSPAMRRVQNDYSRYFNRCNRRDGSLFRGRFFSKLVDSDDYLEAVIRYIDANAVDARLAEHPCSYPWSSGWSYARSSGPPWLSRELVESVVTARVVAPATDSNTYRLFTASGLSGAQREWVERGFVRGKANDGELDDLIGAAPPRVREWMARKSMLADGCQASTPVASPTAVASAIDVARTSRPEWIVRPHGRDADAWSILLVGLFRSATRMTWREISNNVDAPLSTCQRRFEQHRSSLASNPEYAARSVKLVHAAISTTRGLAANRVTGESG